MRYSELFERSLSDVGVTAGKFYLAATARRLDIEKLKNTGTISGITGISSSRKIWHYHGPNVGRDLLFIMNAESILKANKVNRVKYDNVDDLLKDNSKMLGRIYNVSEFSEIGSGSNLIMSLAYALNKTGILDRDDVASLNNNTMRIIDKDREEGSLSLSSIDDYRNVLHRAALLSYYTKKSQKTFSPQNRNRINKVISSVILELANRYATEQEWVIEGDLIVPKDTIILFSVNKAYLEPYAKSDLEFLKGQKVRAKQTLKDLKDSGYDIRVVDEQKTSQSLLNIARKQLPD